MANIADERLTKMRDAHFKNRSGDVLFNLFPGWYEVNEKNETMGVTSYVNSRVPVILYGISNNAFLTAPTTSNLAATLCQIMQIPFPNACVGAPATK